MEDFKRLEKQFEEWAQLVENGVNPFGIHEYETSFKQDFEELKNKVKEVQDEINLKKENEELTENSKELFNKGFKFDSQTVKELVAQENRMKDSEKRARNLTYHREVNFLHPCIIPRFRYEFGKKGVTHWELKGILNLKTEETYDYNENYNSYEEAEEQAIEKIRIIIQEWKNN